VLSAPSEGISQNVNKCHLSRPCDLQWPSRAQPKPLLSAYGLGYGSKAADEEDLSLRYGTRMNSTPLIGKLTKSTC